MISILQGDWIEVLKTLPEKSVQCCVTSPPYWGLRDYGVAGQLGLEKTPEEYVAKVVAGFREVRRVLRDDGTLWVNVGDSYYNYRTGYNGALNKQTFHKGPNGKPVDHAQGLARRALKQDGLKEKDLVGIPWRVAFALQADGWYLRSDIIWSKPNPMPESVTDRPTKSHEYIFLLSKSQRYFYDHESIKDPPSPALLQQISEGYNGSALKDYLTASVQDASATKSRIIDGYRKRIDKQRGHSRRHAGFNDKWDALTPQEQACCGRNKRDVWSIAPANFKDAHFATFPPKLIEPCILAGSKIGDTVLDPFGGSGTTGMVSEENGRNSILIELNPKYIELAQKRTKFTVPIPKQKTLWDTQNCSAA